ncbi:MAG: PQQ-binding-like beta-propeller repeat protein [Ktedonobacteraceae bacterium]|nr:PQQ-binding-like beta-propeller repeat protein [Ktedonobacteraceae bacterium]
MLAIRAFVCGCVLCIMLAGCSDPSLTQPVKITPLALPPSTATPQVSASADWTTYHYNNARDGYVAATPDPGRLTGLWSKQLDGPVYAEPLLVGGHVLVATENDALYSLDAHNGQVQWRTSLGTPVPLSELPCGNIDPLGITGTPVYDAQTGLVFAVAEVTGPGHILFGVDARTGQIRVRRSVDPAGMNPQVHQQRAALALFGGRVYVAYGGLDGDCGNYHGWVVASRTDGRGSLLSYQVPTAREGGIWAASGPAVDSAGHVYVAVGNGEAVQGNWDHSDSVLRLSTMLQLADGFASQNWQSENATDSDLGSMGPLLLPGGMIFADGKAGQGYLLRANTLGGVGGQAQAISLCSAFGGAAALGLSVFVPCIDGLRQVQVRPGTSLTPGWHAPSQVTGSPVVGGHTVYSLDPPNGMLYAFDAATGKVRATFSVGTTSRFATPTLSQRDIFIGTMTGIVAVAIA